MKLGGLVVVASNAGGAWTSAVGDVNGSQFLVPKDQLTKGISNVVSYLE